MDTHTLKGMIDMTVTTTNINQMLFAQTIGNMGTLAPFVLLETNFYACPNLMQVPKCATNSQGPKKVWVPKDIDFLCMLSQDIKRWYLIEVAHGA